MPRDGTNRFYYPPGTEAVANDTARSADVNSRMAALLEDNNIARPISAGGTGATYAAQARTNLDVPSNGEAVLKTGGEMTGWLTVKNRVNVISDADNTSGVYLYGNGGNPRVMVQFLGGADRMAITLRGADGSNQQVISISPSGVTINADQIITASMSGARNTNAVGSIAFARSTAAASIDVVVAGSTLSPAGVTSAGALFVGSSSFSGSWRARGACPAGGATDFERIS